MRLWSLHPRYLDSAGLVACWREALLARAVLAGRTVGYRHHPQLIRFRNCENPVAGVDCYLTELLHEAQRRGYRFDGTKIGSCDCGLKIVVTEGQLAYEWVRLKEKLNRRAPQALVTIVDVAVPEPHPMFVVKAGEVEEWEKRT